MTEPGADAATAATNRDPVARFFEFDREGTSYRREIVGGVTTFLAMAYIMFVNPRECSG